VARVFKAATIYFACVFCIGFVLGTFRVLVLNPLVGEFNATALEIPIMLTVSWFVCRRVMRRFAIPRTMSSGVAVGGLAFALLMIAELGLSVLLFDRTLTQYFDALQSDAGMLGFAAQIAFALFPLLQLRRSRHS
jgi:hypothetical protein